MLSSSTTTWRPTRGSPASASPAGENAAADFVEEGREGLGDAVAGLPGQQDHPLAVLERPPQAGEQVLVGQRTHLGGMESHGHADAVAVTEGRDPPPSHPLTHVVARHGVVLRDRLEGLRPHVLSDELPHLRTGERLRIERAKLTGHARERLAPLAEVEFARPGADRDLQVGRRLVGLDGEPAELAAAAHVLDPEEILQSRRIDQPLFDQNLAERSLGAVARRGRGQRLDLETTLEVLFANDPALEKDAAEARLLHGGVSDPVGPAESAAASSSR